MSPEEEDGFRRIGEWAIIASQIFEEPPPRPLTLGEKLRRLFDYDFPRVHDVYTRSVWVVGELLEFDGQFNKYIQARGLQRQEGILFRHVLRFILLCDEFATLAPFETTPETWEDPFDEWIERLSASCRGWILNRPMKCSKMVWEPGDLDRRHTETHPAKRLGLNVERWTLRAPRTEL